MLLEKHCDQCWSKRVTLLRGWTSGLEPIEKRELIREIKHNLFQRFTTDFLCWEKGCLSAWGNRGICVWVWFTSTVTQAALTPTVLEHCHSISKIPLPREMHLPLVVNAFLVYSGIFFFEKQKQLPPKHSEFLGIIPNLLLLNYMFLQTHRQLR